MPDASASPAVTSSSPCPCGSGNLYDDCCGAIISGQRSAPDAEALMRSRYSAHVVRDFHYLHRTYLATAKLPYTEEGITDATQWEKLEIHSHEPDIKPGVSQVDFSAYFTENGRPGVMHEKSEFEHIDGAWIFTRTIRQGPAPVVAAPKVGRNDPCPCGSGKKYKKCCG